MCKFCRAREELSNEYAVCTCKNRLRYSRERASQILKVIQLIFSFHSLRVPHDHGVEGARRRGLAEGVEVDGVPRRRRHEEVLRRLAGRRKAQEGPQHCEHR